MSARVIPMPQRASLKPTHTRDPIDWSVHTAVQAGAPYRALPGPATQAPHARAVDHQADRSRRDLAIDRLCWLAFFALLGAVVLLLRWWMSLAQGATRWIT